MEVNKNNSQKTFNTPTLKIEGNGIDCQDTFIHIKNITQIWIGEIPKKSLPILYLLCLVVVGFILFIVNFFIGLIPLAIAAVVFIIYNKQITYYGMNIELSSGRIYSFTSSNKKYLLLAYDCIKSIINKPSDIGYNINLNNGDLKQYNFKNNNMINNSIVQGDVE